MEIRHNDTREEFMYEHNETYTSEPSAMRASDTDEEDEVPEKKPRVKESMSERLMRLAGYGGKGLGRHEQGIQEPIEATAVRGRLGLGHGAQKVARISFK